MTEITVQHSADSPYDVIIVGSGLTGGWAAKELAEAGCRVLILEAGPLRSSQDAYDLQPWTESKRLEQAKRQPIQSRHPSYWSENPTLFVDDLENPYTNGVDPFIWIRGRQVGGRSLTWGGVALRFSNNEFLAAEQDGFGPLWPLRYEELAPFYDKVEEFLKVEGSRDGLPQLPDGVYAPPPCFTETEQRFKQQIESRWKTRNVIISRGVPALRSGEGVGWSARSSLANTLPAAFRSGRTKLQPDSVVSHLLINRTNARIQGVACIDRVTKRNFEVFGRVVLLCASTLESVRIMLNSKGPQHENGVGNSSALLGRYIFDHLCVGISGVLYNGRRVKVSPSGGANGILIPRFSNFSEVNSFIRGYGIWGKMQRGGAVISEGTADWLLHSLLEVLPREENRIEIDENKKDSWGINTIRVALSYSENELAMKQDAIARMAEMAHTAHLQISTTVESLPGQYVHELGGARMGSDPKNSVLNSFNQCWDAKNLFVLDGASFVTSG